MVRRTESVSLRDGRLRLAVIADTHSSPHPRAAALVAKACPDRVLHAGDIGSPEVLKTFEGIAPVVAVRGNIDPQGLPDLVQLAVQDEDARVLFRSLLLHIGVSGPKLRADARRHAAAEDAMIVICGHSHVPFLGRDRGVTIFNPGSIGPRRFHLPIVFGVLEVTRGESGIGVEMFHVSCETGERWLP